jgi:HK97 family phage major capsid protein
VTAVTIAAWKKLGRQELADVAGLANIIESRLVYLVSRRIENQIVNGSGVGENLLGILNSTGIGSVAYSSSSPVSDLILAGLTQVRLANAEPSAILLNPVTYQAMLEAKATGSGERLDSGGAFESPADAIWGVKVIQSPVIGPNQALVADWGRATTLYVREAVNARVSDADQDDFLRNRVTMLAEARVGLALWQPSAIVVVDLA